jgi:hypothetical protein
MIREHRSIINLLTEIFPNTQAEIYLMPQVNCPGFNPGLKIGNFLARQNEQSKIRSNELARNLCDASGELLQAA